ncbi:MAG: hypothetical protein E6K75_04410 [Candidatus Eisenbacteria bacterium]|uniref:DUF3098 domain-containing protein n=1 Tax=Eiseniibacteriota bacterium TaxID=2212470 RepID=A0A538T6I0_UNCEI|nr:MAG: hypothetical protein E6K75_04410 [Candidatus Eisenbacteria bacterium]
MPTPSEIRRQRRGPGQRPAEPPDVDLPFGKKNYMLFGVAALVIIAGYVALSKGSITVAPILLLLGYLVLIPIAILAK